jgi:hypothetical protein
MFKEVLNHANLAHWAEMGLLIFFVVFVGVSIWAFTRSRETIRNWALLPLEDETPGRRNTDE